MTESRKPRVAELFAGVGGFRIALERGGWQVVWANQWEPSTKTQPAFECYTRHFSEGEHVCEDLARVMDEAEAGERQIPDLELLVGGYPCQDYSVSKPLAYSKGLQGKKGVLWWEIVRLLTLKRPKTIFLENVDRLLKSPAHQRGRDFAVMLAALSDLGYDVEWRVVNAADYGFPQKRRRVFIVGKLAPVEPVAGPMATLTSGVLARALPIEDIERIPDAGTFEIAGTLDEVTEHFGSAKGVTPFRKAGVMSARQVWTVDVKADYDGPFTTLGDILQPEADVPAGYRVDPARLASWRYQKGAKNEERTAKNGFSYRYTEGALPFPDRTDIPARTILTSEGGSGPSRSKHIVATSDGGYRRLTPIELERIDGFPDDWTAGMSANKRAFMMGNALVVGLIERVGRELIADLPQVPDRPTR